MVSWNWGVQKNNYIRTGVSQVLSRLTFGATLSHLRRVMIPVGKEGKNAKIRQIHSSQMMYICNVECFDPNTPILTWDGGIKLAKDIVVGDILIDDKGKPTRVRKTVSGRSLMYEVKTEKNEFLDYTVTSNHILTLKRIDNNYKDSNLKFDEDGVIDITISDYKELPDKLKDNLYIYKWKKEPEMTKFKLFEKDVGDFVGWQLEGNGRFLLSDFSVTHNTPEGASIGIVLNMSLLTKVTKRIPTVLVREIVEMSKNLVSFNDMEDEEICQNKTKIFLNGILLGVVKTDQNDFIKEMEGFRKSGLLNKQISFSYNDVDNEINIYSDEGRFIRPLFTLTEDKSKLKIYEKEGELSTNWEELVENGYIQYLDNSEIENKVLAMYETDLPKYKCDLAEICPAMMLGVMASIIPFPDHSQAPRNLYQSSINFLVDNRGN